VGVAQIFAKIPEGFKTFRKKLPGGSSIFDLIAFLLTSFSKNFLWNSASSPLPLSPPVCNYDVKKTLFVVVGINLLAIVIDQTYEEMVYLMLFMEECDKLSFERKKNHSCYKSLNFYFPGSRNLIFFTTNTKDLFL
jgi:hypothetical protein